MPKHKPMPKHKKFNYSISNPILSTKTMPFSTEKEEILLSNALEAYNSGQFKSIKSAASHFNVSKWKLRNRNEGRPSKKGRAATN